MPKLGETKAATWEQKNGRGNGCQNQGSAWELNFVLFFLMMPDFNLISELLTNHFSTLNLSKDTNKGLGPMVLHSWFLCSSGLCMVGSVGLWSLEDFPNIQPRRNRRLASRANLNWKQADVRPCYGHAWSCYAILFCLCSFTTSTWQWRMATNQIPFRFHVGQSRSTEDSTSGGFSLQTVQAEVHHLQLGVFLVATPWWAVEECVNWLPNSFNKSNWCSACDVNMYLCVFSIYIYTIIYYISC